MNIIFYPWTNFGAANSYKKTPSHCVSSTQTGLQFEFQLVFADTILLLSFCFFCFSHIALSHIYDCFSLMHTYCKSVITLYLNRSAVKRRFNWTHATRSVFKLYCLLTQKFIVMLVAENVWFFLCMLCTSTVSLVYVAALFPGLSPFSHHGCCKWHAATQDQNIASGLDDL